MMKWDAYQTYTLQNWTPAISTLQSSFSLICAGTGYLSNLWRQNIQSSFFVRVHLAWSSSDQAVIQIMPLEFQSSQTDVHPTGNWKARRLQSRLDSHSRTETLGAFCPHRKTQLNVRRASSINSCHRFTLIITEEEQIKTEKLLQQTQQQECWRPLWGTELAGERNHRWIFQKRVLFTRKMNKQFIRYKIKVLGPWKRSTQQHSLQAKLT